MDEKPSWPVKCKSTSVNEECFSPGRVCLWRACGFSQGGLALIRLMSTSAVGLTLS